MRYTITSAARAIGKSRQWISGIVNQHDIGTRVSPTVIFLTDADLRKIRRVLKENSTHGKFIAGNTMHLLRKHPGRKNRESTKS